MDNGSAARDDRRAPTPRADMTITAETPADLTPTDAHPRLRQRDHVITGLAGLWLMIGLFVDGWAHNNLAQLETFFTPWHGLFYSGFTASALWMLWLVHRERRRRGGGSLVDAIPDGYGLGIVGLGLFAVGGVGDMLWHIRYGIEVSVDALYSPTHVLLIAGITLVLSSPWRAASHDPAPVDRSLRTFAATLMSATLVLTLYAFAFMYWMPWFDDWASAGMMRWARSADLEQLVVLQGMASLFTPVILFLGTLLLLARRWRLPFGSATILFGVPALMVAGLHEFNLVALVPSAVLAGLVADVLLGRLGVGTTPLRIVGATIPPLLVGSYLALLAWRVGLGWDPEFTFGIVAWSSAVGLGLSLLVAAPYAPAPPAPGAQR